MRFGLLGLSVLAVVLLTALIGASVAQAANSFVPSGEIGSGELVGPTRIAVDPTTGNVLVVDSTEHRVDVYGSSGPGAGLLTTFGESDLSAPYGIAVDQSNGDVYVTDSGNEQILRYSTDGASPPTYTLDASYTGPVAGTGSEEVGSFASAIAVDPTDGDLLVADRGNSRVSRFDASGTFVSSFDGSDSGAAFTHLEDIALSPAGKIFVTDGEAVAGGPSRVLRFSDAGAFEATLGPAAGTGDAYLAYDSKHTELIVGDGRECFFCNVSIHVLDPTDGAVLFDVPVPSEQITGLAADPGSGRLYAASLRGEFFAPAKIEVLAPHTHPGLVLDPPGPVTPFTVHLSGTVDPDGVATEYQFEISKDGGTTWQKSPEPAADAGEGTAAIPVEADLTVEPNNHYIAKLVASNTEGVTDSTPTQPFDTPTERPGVHIGAASAVTETEATLTGTINPYGLQTTYYFEYGATTAYGSRTPIGIEGVAGGGRVAEEFSRTISGLTPGATYHFRLVAKSTAGVSTSADQTFATSQSSGATSRAYEQVTPNNKNGAAIISRIGLLAEQDGDGITYLTKSGPKSAPLYVRSAAVRQQDDWQGAIQTDPPLNVSPGFFLIHPTLAVSEDFTHTLVASNRVLAPGGTENGGNLYREDLQSGTYEFVGGSGAPETLNSFTGTLTNNVVMAMAPDLSWVVFYSRNPLLPDAPRHATYRWSTSTGLEVVSILPDGEMSSSAHGQAYQVYYPVSADGSMIYFTGFGGSEEGVFLHEAGGGTKAISVSHVSGGPVGPQPAVLLGTNETGRYAFFVSSEKLTNDATATRGSVYRYDAFDGSLEYLGFSAFTVIYEGPDGWLVTYGSFGISPDGSTLYFNEGTDTTGPFSVWHDGTTHAISTASVPLAQERMSPNGRYYVFYKNPGEVWLYDAVTNQQVCVSCTSTGVKFDAQLPVASEAPDSVIDNRHSMSVNDDGTVFFDTRAQVVPKDTNGTRDVYAWADGSFELISPGDQDYNAYYADSSGDGSDVFFTTQQGLVTRDVDQSIDIYDARVGGGLAGQNVSTRQECAGAACKSSVGESAPSAAGSERLSGPGNVQGPLKKACTKPKRRKAGPSRKCAKKAKHSGKRRKHRGKANRANKNGGK